ncbi:MAG: DUF1926 domain-containing protein [Armatimonadetes bacterium]|nr:DUF1926 domain-containing protein [Armatimonadota bacterium]
MPKTIHLALGIHNHQPVGNFDHVIEECYKLAYGPFLKVLEKFPQIPLSLHISGILLEWLVEHKPQYVKKLRKLISRSQVEMLTGGFYEPILPAIPDRDKVGQVRKLTRYLKSRLGADPKGAWIAERVWEPHLAKPLAQAGVEYTVLDETHFRYAGVPPEGIFGTYVTEEQGRHIRVFPISYQLRYLIPFSPPEKTLEYLEKWACEDGLRVAVMADDGEKFGGWPNTHKSVYEDGWLERFFRLLTENASWIRMGTFTEIMSSVPALGLVYLPTASYFEMMQWALPVQGIRELQKIQNDLRQHDRYDEFYPFLKGGFWRNFLSKYPESNNLHKKALLVSETVAAMKDGPRKDEAQEELWMGQCNCAYWHGLFGGLYLTHLRSALYRHLIRAERKADEILHPDEDWFAVKAVDFDLDSEPEILFSSHTLNLYFSPSEGGTLFELDYRPGDINLLDVMTRREETYHQRVKARRTESPESGDEGARERVRPKEEELDKFLVYDSARRVTLVDRFLHPYVTAEDLSSGEAKELASFSAGPYRSRITDGTRVTLTAECPLLGIPGYPVIHLKKRVDILGSLPGFAVSIRLENRGSSAANFLYGMEWNFGLSSGDDDLSGYILNGQGAPAAGLRATDRAEDIQDLVIRDDPRKLDLRFSLNPKGSVFYYPIETVSQSEGGFERNFQGVCMVHNWSVRLVPHQVWETEIRFSIEPYDRRTHRGSEKGAGKGRGSKSERGNSL